MSSRHLALGGGVAILAIAASAPIWLGLSGRREAPGSSAGGDIVSIVVLPSKVVADASDQFLTDAIPNTISAHLTQVKGLETKVPPTSGEVERVRGDLGKLADAYGVSAFVLSSLTANADRLVLAANQRGAASESVGPVPALGSAARTGSTRSAPE